MFEVRYRGKPIMVSRAAMRELCDEGMDLQDVLTILEEGFPSPRKRAQGTIEYWLIRGKKTFEVVLVAEYHHVHQEEVWVLIHLSIFTTR